jgi:hypothetical protein
MSQTPSTTTRSAPGHAAPSPERRPAIWPWVVMPAAALAMFVTLHTLRHNGVASQSAARAQAASTPASR